MGARYKVVKSTYKPKKISIFRKWFNKFFMSKVFILQFYCKFKRITDKEKSYHLSVDDEEMVFEHDKHDVAVSHIYYILKETFNINIKEEEIDFENIETKSKYPNGHYYE